MTPSTGIGARARAAITAGLEDLTQAQVAEQLGMAPDALSRALNGKRGFAAIELAQLADLTGVDLHELITGDPDPQRMVFVARHTVDPVTRQRANPSKNDDGAALDRIRLAYRQAGDLPASRPLPPTAGEVREILGEDFVLPFADRLEERLNIDVLRTAELSTSYSFVTGRRQVIAVPAVASWFWENWCLAHELGHLWKRHHDTEQVPDLHEDEADDFAADLLMPVEQMTEIDWTTISTAQFALLVWRLGVSTKAVLRRLSTLRLPHNPALQAWASVPTQRLLRRHLVTDDGEFDEITRRMTNAATRRVPLALTDAHLSKIAAGLLGKETLAWMLQVPVSALDVETPTSPPEPDLDDLTASLGLTAAS